jgi:hypothetical protein
VGVALAIVPLAASASGAGSAPEARAYV